MQEQHLELLQLRALNAEQKYFKNLLMSGISFLPCWPAYSRKLKSTFFWYILITSYKIPNVYVYSIILFGNILNARAAFGALAIEGIEC